MDTFLVAVFETEEAAFRGAESLRDLHRKSALTVHAAAIIHKTPDGTVGMKEAAEEGPVGAAFGMMVGALVGVLAGPLAAGAGAAVGAAAASGAVLGTASGGLVGLMGDLVRSGIDSEFLEIVGTELQPGCSAVVASVDEAMTLPVDKAMAAQGGRVFRQPRIDTIDAELEAQAAILSRRAGELKAEFNAASEADRDILNTPMHDLRDQLKALEEQVSTRQSRLTAEVAERSASLTSQIEAASDETSDRFARRLAELTEDTALRLKALERAAGVIESARALVG